MINLLDIRTVMFSQLLTDAVCTAVMAYVWARNRARYRGLLLLTLDLAFQMTAVILIILRGTVPNWMTFELANILVVAGAMLGFAGLEHYLEKKSGQIHNYLFLALFSALYFYFTEIQNSLDVRTILGSVGILFFSLQCLWLLFRRIEAYSRPPTRLVGIAYAGFGLVSLARIFFTVVFPYKTNDFFQSGLYDALSLMAYQLLIILLTFGQVLMVNLRLLNEVKVEEEKFNKAFRTSPYAITFTRLPDGKMLDANEGFLKISGYAMDEVIGKTTEALGFWVKDSDRKAVIDELRKFNRSEGKEYQFRIKSGKQITGFLTAEIIILEGQPRVLSIINDVTMQKKAEKKVIDYSDHLKEMVEKRTQELRAAREKLERKERMAMLGQLAGSVGHELRAPLGVISNAIYFLKMAQPEADAKVKEYHDIIQKEVANSDKIITDLLDFSRIKKVEREAFGMKALIVSVLERFPKPEAVRTIVDVPDDLPLAFADQRQITQVLGNLVLNAYQAMPDGGEVAISAAVSEKKILVRVKDTGVGIQADDLGKLFSPLFTTKPRGIGLGLTVCKMLMEANDGKITVSSEEGKGSEFSIYIPAQEVKNDL